MRVSDQGRFVFVHVPKTGGSTIDRMLDAEVPDVRSISGVPRHSGMDRILGAEPDLSGYWFFAFVRNPWDRMVSWWAMVCDVLSKVDAGDPDAIKRVEGHRKFWRPARTWESFETFVERGPESYPRLGLPQVDLLAHEGRAADFVGRQENFARDLGAVRERIGLGPVTSVPRDNASPHRPYRDYYTPRTRALVADMYAADLAAYAYEF